MNTNLHNQTKNTGTVLSANTYFPYSLKIRAMRDPRDMSQGELGQMAGIAQPWVSKLENPSNGTLTISTLLKLASAFDMASYIDFVPFSELLRRASDLSNESFEVPSFDGDAGLVPTVPKVPDIETGKELLSGKGQRIGTLQTDYAPPDQARGE